MAAGPLAAHGSTARFNGSPAHNLPACRCPRCANAQHRYTARLRHYEHVAHTEYGAARAYDTVPGAQVTAHVNRLFADGAGWVQIALAARCSQETVSRVHRGTTERLRWTTACHLLAVRPEDATPPWRSVPAGGSIRRVRALAAIGHYCSHIITVSGASAEAVRALLNGRQASIAATTAARIADAYEQLRWTAGTSERMRNRALRAGWPGPLAWDVDTIDDQDAQPDLTGAAKPRRQTKRSRPDEITAEVHHLAGLGESAHFIAKQLGRSEKRITQLMPGYGEAA